MVNTTARNNDSLNMSSIPTILISAVLLLVTAMISVHAFVPSNTQKFGGGRCTVANHISIKQPSQLLPSTNIYPCISTTTSLSAHAPLQPGKGGIIVEAKSNFIARDVLIDSMMGRGNGLPSDDNTILQEKDEFEDFSSNEDSWLSSSNSMSAAQPANRRSSPMGIGMGQQQSVGNNRQNRPSNKAGMSREQMVQQLNSGQQFTQQQQQQQQPPPPPQAPPPPSNQPQTPLLDPTQLKISQIQSELTSYSISYDDCFDRTSLEKKLREVRLVMGVAGTMDGDSRRNQQQNVEGGEEERGFNLDNLQQSTPIQQSPPPIQPPPIQPPQQNNFGNSGAGGFSSFSPPQGAFNTGGVSIKGDASILSSSGFVGGDGNVFSTGPPGQQPPPQQPSNLNSGGPSIEELINQQNKVRASKSSRTSPAEQAIFTSSVSNTFSNKKRSPPPPPRRQQPPSSNNNSNVLTPISSGYRDNTRPLQPMPKAASGSSVGNVSGGGSTSTFNSGQQSSPRPPQQTKSTTSARNTNSVQQTPTGPTPGNASTGNPFSSNNRRASTQQGGVGNSFRDSAHGIGFGDVNSYTSTSNSRPTPGNASSGNPSRRNSSARGNTAGQPSGDGVRLGKQRTSYGDFNSGSSIGGDFGSNSSGGSSAPQSNIGGSSASFRNGNANPPPPRSNTAPPQQQVGGPSGRKNSSVSGGGGTSTFSSSSSPSTPISNFGSSDFGPASSMNAGGVSIKGDSSILSSFGQVGQGGSTNVFSSGQAAASPQAPPPPPQNVNVPPPQQHPYDPTPPMEEPQLDWLTQDSTGGGNSYIPTSPEPPSVTSDYGSASHNDDMYSQQQSPTSSYNGKRISELYQEQRLDMFSGNQEGFGVVQGVENTGGDVSYRGSADDVKVQGKVGDMGATMGGDFGGSSGGSARYSQGRGYTDMGSDDDV